MIEVRFGQKSSDSLQNWPDTARGDTVRQLRYDTFMRRILTPLTLVSLLTASVLVGLFIWSAQIPKNWERISRGMKREEIREMIGGQPSPNDLSAWKEDSWTIRRPIGLWHLRVLYKEDESFWMAHLSYTLPIRRSILRARNYSEDSLPYEQRATR